MMYLESWQRLISDGLLVGRDLLCVNSGGYSMRGPIKSVRLEDDRLFIAVDWWAQRIGNDDEWVHVDLNKRQVFSVGWSEPIYDNNRLRLRWGTGDTGAAVLPAGLNLVKSLVKTEFYIEAHINGQNIYAGQSPFELFEGLGLVKAIKPRSFQRNEDVEVWGAVLVIKASTLRSATNEARQRCRRAGFKPGNLRRTQLLPGH